MAREGRRRCDMGLDVYLVRAGQELPIEMPSGQHPDHLFKVGYFRSSYNPSGFNSVLRDFLKDDCDLYYIMGQTWGGPGEFAPDWKVCWERGSEVLARLKKAMARDGGMFYALSVRPRNAVAMLKRYTPDAPLIRTGAEAIQAVRDERANHIRNLELAAEKGGHAWDNYHNSAGNFYMGEHGAEVVGMVSGVAPTYDADAADAEEPAVWVVLRGDRAAGEWYVKALEVVVETCAWVLNRPEGERGGYRVSWSG